MRKLIPLLICARKSFLFNRLNCTNSNTNSKVLCRSKNVGNENDFFVVKTNIITMSRNHKAIVSHAYIFWKINIE